MSTTDDKKARARKWVNGYTVAGTAVVIAAIIPGTTSTALAAMEAHMCYQIGKIYRGEDYTMKEAVAVARIVGLVAIAAPMVALEAANAVPIAGWAVKGTIAGGVIKTLGEANYFVAISNAVGTTISSTATIEIGTIAGVPIGQIVSWWPAEGIPN